MPDEGPQEGIMSHSTAKILVIDDKKPVCLTCKRILESEGHTVDYVLSGLEGIKQTVAGDYEVVLLDLKMPDISGMEVLDQIKQDRPDVTIVIITAYATIQTSIEAIKKGAFDYVPKPFTPDELAVAVARALEDRRMRDENEYLKQELLRLKTPTNILGRSKAIEDIRRQILKIAPSDFTVTISGESGTGKELTARAIHDNSHRADRAFVAVDISALSPNLVESELFGHVKGAFTGATRNRAGYFSIASGGTLFLDEVANISPELQGKLLRVLESRRVRAVGSEVEHEVDVRIITATNCDLYHMVEQGTFREDLYYRLNVIPLTVPPLRDRPDDIPLLATHFLKKATESTQSPITGLTTKAMAKMISYHWPGNVRELKNIIERLVATVDHEFIDLEHLPLEISGQTATPGELQLAEIPRTTDELKESKRRLKEMVYEKVESQFVLNALQQSDWNVSKAAEMVGMQRTNFHALMRKYNIRSRDHSTD